MTEQSIASKIIWLWQSDHYSIHHIYLIQSSPSPNLQLNNYIYRWMNEKTQRYLHRIDQIMLTPTKAAPLARPSKSPLTGRSQHLSKYINYEISSKIIQNIITKNHLQLTYSFFNSLRNTEFRQREKIYRFIAV